MTGIGILRAFDHPQFKRQRMNVEIKIFFTYHFILTLERSDVEILQQTG